MRKFSFFLLLLFFTAASAWAQCNLVCPGDMLITLNPGQCEWPASYDARTKDCNPDYQIIAGALPISPTNESGIYVGSGPLPGDHIYHGTTENVKLYLLIDGVPVDSCDFDITVRDWQWPITNLACNDIVQVAVDHQCNGLVTPDMILEGGPYACYDKYSVEIFSYMPADTWGATGDISNPAPLGVWHVGVYDETGNNCWSVIHVVDKIPPSIECVCPEGGQYSAGAEFPGRIYGSFSNDSRVANLSYTCWDFGSNNNVPAQGIHYYDVYPLIPSMTGSYTIQGSDANGKMIIGVFNQQFNPAFPCQGMLGGDGGWNGGSYTEPNFTVYLIAGQTYYIVASDFDAQIAGLYSMDIFGPSGANLHFAKSIYSPLCEFVGCYIPGVQYEFPLPYYSDNCGGAILTWNQTVTKGQECGTYIVRRDYTVTDGSGNTAECSSEYFFRGMDLANLEWPKNWDDLPNNNPMLLCDGDFPLDWNGNPSPDHTGWPVGWDIACEDVEVFYTDKVYTSPPWGSPLCGVKILREWTVVDDCTGAIYKHTQIIRITDKEAPEFKKPADFEVTTKAFVCEADFIIPKLTNLTDNCDPNPKYWVTSSVGTIVGDANGNGFYDANETWMVVGVPIGVYQLCYHAVDNCDNERVKCIQVTVVDKTPPIPVCEQFKTVSLTHDGIAKVHAYSFDSGSFDNCGPIWFKVLRVNDDFVYDNGCRDLNIDKSNEITGNTSYFDDEVFFCCDDLGNEVMVTLRVFDKDPGPGAVLASRMLPGGDLHGHYNDCWNITLVECKIPPLISCPPVTVTCIESLIPSENIRLMPQVAGICGVDLDYTDGPKDDICGGEFTRLWTAEACGKTVQCQQRITIIDDQPFDPCTIVFPSDVTTECYDPISDQKPTWVQNPCNVITAEVVREDTFKFIDGACYMIFREWAVIDWCVYKHNTGAEYNLDPIMPVTRKIDCREESGFVRDGYYRYTQILKMVDYTKPVVIAPEVCIPSVDCSAYNVKITATATDDCNPFKQFYWSYILRDAVTYEVIQYSYNYHPKPATGKSGTLSEKLNKLTKVEVAEMTVIDPLPIGDYYLIWTVDDGCGNVSTKQQLVRVVDKKAPTPLMVNLATAVMENGMVEIQARWFDKGGCGDDCVSSYDNCTPSNDLYFTYTPMLPKLWNNPTQWNNYYNTHGFMTFDPVTGNFVNDPAPAYPQFNSGNAHRWHPNLRTSSRVWICDYAYGANFEIEINVYVWDKFALDDDCDDNNYDYATVTLNFTHCDTEPQPFVNLIGLVGLENMNMQARHTEGAFSAKSQGGKYSMQVYANTSYDVTGTKDSDWLNGVTTLDLVMIQKHILGMSTITDPYKLLAADINNSGSISAADLLEGRQVILGIKDRFVNNSWIAVNPEYSFVNPVNAAAEALGARTRKANVGNTSLSGINFDVVKVGDLNSSANAVESRSSEALRMLVDNITLKEGQIIEIPVYAENFTDVYGAQFTMNITGLMLEEVLAGELAIHASNYNVVNNNLMISYNDAKGATLADGSVLFSLKVKSNADASLADLLDINDRMLRSEIYIGDELSILSLEIGYRNADATNALYQNEPNPFVGETVIGFALAKSSDFRITVFDATGRQVWATTGTGTAGYNSVTLAKTDLDANGVLYYRLESHDFTETRKMIAIK